MFAPCCTLAIQQGGRGLEFFSVEATCEEVPGRGKVAAGGGAAVYLSGHASGVAPGRELSLGAGGVRRCERPKIGGCSPCLFRKTTFTLFTSATLLDQYWKDTGNPVLFRDGFSTELLDAEVETPPEVARLPRPRFLYLGGINRKFWVEAIKALCDGVPHGSVILMGPVVHSEVVLPKLSNLHLLPPRRRYIELAGVLQAADAGLIPYRPDPYAGAMHPAKLNEYLVFGLPVVASATPELEKLAQEFPFQVIYFGMTPQDFAEAGLRALTSNIHKSEEKIRDFIIRLGWPERVKEFVKLCEDKAAVHL